MSRVRAPALSVRADLAAVAPYVSPQFDARHRMSTNESPYAPPKDLATALSAAIEAEALNRYPDRDATSLLGALAEHAGWPVEGLWIANGSNEVFLHLFLGFGGPARTSLTFEPTYSLHTLIARMAGTRTMQVARTPDFHIDLDAAVDALRSQRPEIVVACSPNNPSGGCEPLDALAVLCEESPGLVIVDEAYGEFAAPGMSARPLLAEFDNLLVTKTFSKAWRLAGVRLGYLMARPEVVSELARVRLPYHLSTLTQRVGEEVLRHHRDTLESVNKVVEQRDHISIELQAMGLEAWPSQANFVLFRVPDADRVWQGLLDRGVLVRNYSGYQALDGCLRVTAGLPEECEAFLVALRETLDG